MSLPTIHYYENIDYFFVYNKYMATQQKKQLFWGITFLVVFLTIIVLSWKFQPKQKPVIGAPDNSSRIDKIRNGFKKK